MTIREYSVGQTTLEQIFIDFAQMQKEETGAIEGMVTGHQVQRPGVSPSPRAGPMPAPARPSMAPSADNGLVLPSLPFPSAFASCFPCVCCGKAWNCWHPVLCRVNRTNSLFVFPLFFLSHFFFPIRFVRYSLTSTSTFASCLSYLISVLIT